MRLTLDLDVFVADLRARQLGKGSTASSYLVNAVRNGRADTTITVISGGSRCGPL